MKAGKNLAIMEYPEYHVFTYIEQIGCQRMNEEGNNDDWIPKHSLSQKTKTPYQDQ